MINTGLKKAVSILGGQKIIGQHLGVAQSCVWKWLHNKSKLKVEKAIEIEKLTNGAVTCEELRPDVNWSVLRKQKSH